MNLHKEADELLNVLYHHTTNTLSLETLHSMTDLEPADLEEVLDYLKHSDLITVRQHSATAPFETISITETGKDLVETDLLYSDQLDLRNLTSQFPGYPGRA